MTNVFVFVGNALGQKLKIGSIFSGCTRVTTEITADDLGDVTEM